MRQMFQGQGLIWSYARLGLLKPGVDRVDKFKIPFQVLMKVDVNLFLSRLSYVMDCVMEHGAVPFITVSYANTFYFSIPPQSALEAFWLHTNIYLYSSMLLK